MNRTRREIFTKERNYVIQLLVSATRGVKHTRHLGLHRMFAYFNIIFPPLSEKAFAIADNLNACVHILDFP